MMTLKGAVCLKHYDVIVAGGGPAGITAAAESARQGAETLLVERCGCLGGNLTLGLVGPFMGSVGPGTAADELIRLLGSPYPEAVCFDAEEAKYRLAEYVKASGADVLLQTSVIGVSAENGVIRSAELAGKGGRFSAEADLFVDATGDGDLAVLAGADYEMGREKDGLMQPMSILFVIGGADPEQHLVCHHEKDETVFPDGRSYLRLCREACEAGELPETVNIVRLYATGRPDERMVNATQLNGVSGLDAPSLFDADLELRRQIEMCCAFLRRRVPGFEHIFLRSSASLTGVRESRRILGDTVLTADDLAAGRKFEDAAVHNACFCVDIHNPSGAGQADGADRLKVRPYDIPFGCMRPRGIENLLTCGRCISGTHEAHASYRVMVICMAMGQAAGIAAATAARLGCTTRQLDIREVRKRMADRGVRLNG